MTTATKRQIAVFTATTTIAFALIAWRAELRFIPLDPGADSFYYARMAVGYPDHLILSPFQQRILIPLLIHALPFPVPWGFAVVNSAMLGVTFTAMYRLLTRWFTARVVWFGLAVLATCGLVTGIIGNPYYVDVAVLAAAAVVFVCLEEDRWTPLLLVVPLAVASHELSLVLLIPIAITGWRQKKIPDAVVLGVLGVGMWWVMHRSGWIIPKNTRPNLFTAGYREEMVRFNAMRNGTVMGAVWVHVMASYGVAWLLAPLGVKGASRVLKDGLWMLPACAVLCLTGSDWSRMFLPAMPVVIGLACAAMSPAGKQTAEPAHQEMMQ